MFANTLKTRQFLIIRVAFKIQNPDSVGVNIQIWIFFFSGKVFFKYIRITDSMYLYLWNNVWDACIADLSNFLEVGRPEKGSEVVFAGCSSCSAPEAPEISHKSPHAPRSYHGSIEQP